MAELKSTVHVTFRESQVLLDPLVPLDTRELPACLVSAVLPDQLESRERRYVDTCVLCVAKKNNALSQKRGGKLSLVAPL